MAQLHRKDSVDNFLSSINVPPDLSNLLRGLLQVCGGISEKLRHLPIHAVGTSNAFGDEQLTADLMAEHELNMWANSAEEVRAISSEEDPTLREIKVEGGSYIVCWDPLDGSSIVDCNWTVGAIVGIWKMGSGGVAWNGAKTLIGATGRQQTSSLMVVFGPRTTCLLEVGGKAHHLLYIGDEVIRLPDPSIREGDVTIFAPANLRASQESGGYSKLIEYWMQKRLTLRYTGGLVPDTYQIFVKQQGIFCNPTSERAPPKLRLIFECIPIARLIEAAGGRSSNGLKSILDVAIESMDHRSEFCVGSSEEVARYEEFIM